MLSRPGGHRCQLYLHGATFRQAERSRTAAGSRGKAPLRGKGLKRRDTGHVRTHPPGTGELWVRGPRRETSACDPSVLYAEQPRVPLSLLDTKTNIAQMLVAGFVLS